MALVATMLPRTGPVHENSRSNRRPKCHLNLDHHVSLLAGSTQRYVSLCLRSVRSWQHVGRSPKWLFAGVVAEVERELGGCGRARPEIGRAAGKLRWDHAGV